MASGGNSVVIVSEGQVIIGDVIPARSEGRLTAKSGDPAPGGNGAFGPTLYFTPYKGNVISLYHDGGWHYHTFAEISISNAGLGDNDVRDVFAYWNGSQVALEFSQQYTGFVTRVDAIALQDGVSVKASDHTRKLIGTISAVSSGHLTPPFFFFDTINARLISNLYNAVPRMTTITIPYTDDDAESEITITSNGLWVVPLFLGGEPAYSSWVICEPRMVRIDLHVCLRPSTATIYGTGIGLTPGDDNFDVSTITKSSRSTAARMEDNLSMLIMSPIGMWLAWQAFFAEGGDGKLIAEIDDKRRGAAHDPFLSWLTGWIDN